MRSWTSWQDWTDPCPAIWLFLSPWVIGAASGLSRNARLLGAAAVVVAVSALVAPSYMAAEFIMGVFGIWLFLTPLLFGFSSLAGQQHVDRGHSAPGPAIWRYVRYYQLGILTSAPGSPRERALALPLVACLRTLEAF